MRILITAIIILLGFQFSCGQSFRGLDKSPMDAAYLPDNFAHDRKQGDEAIVKIIYSRPQVKGRKIFGTRIVPYDRIWRLGANEAAEFNAYQDITIGGKKLSKGTYSIYAIPKEKEWTIVLNADLDYWGAYRYNAKRDVVQFTVPVKKHEELVEAFSIQFEDTDQGKAVLRMAWEYTMVEIPVAY